VIEVASLLEEKWFVLGPIIARQHDELLRPLVEHGVEVVLKSGRMPPPPPDLQGEELKIEFVSMLAQAQHAITTNSVDRWLGFVTMTSQIPSKQDVVDVVDADKMVREYGDMINVPSDFMVDPRKVEELRAARNAALAEKEQAALAEQNSKTAKNLATAPTSEANALTELMNGVSGYQSPNAVEAGAL